MRRFLGWVLVNQDLSVRSMLNLWNSPGRYLGRVKSYNDVQLVGPVAFIGFNLSV